LASEIPIVEVKAADAQRVNVRGPNFDGCEQRHRSFGRTKAALPFQVQIWIAVRPFEVMGQCRREPGPIEIVVIVE
jgi:hypothetical protein